MLQYGAYDYSMVGLSVLVAFFASFSALRLALIKNVETGSMPRQWILLTGGVILGCGIWAMHFIGMLAFDLCSQASSQKVASENEVDEELEASVVKDNVHPPFILACLLRFLQDLVRGREVIDQYVVFGFLPRIGTLQLLYIFVGQRCQERKVRSIAP